MIRPRKASAEKSKMSEDTKEMVKKAKDALFSDMFNEEVNKIIVKVNFMFEKDGVLKGFYVAEKRH